MEKELTPEQILARESFAIALRFKQEAALASQGGCGGRYSTQDPQNSIYYCTNDREGSCPNRGRTLGSEGSLERVPYCMLKTGR